jgi:glycerate 2-kinase
MKIIVAPDKFKGSLPAAQVAEAIAAGLRSGSPAAELVTVPVAGRSTLTEDELARAGIAAVYTLSDLEPDPARSSAEADLLLRRVGQAIAHATQVVTTS